MVTYYFPGLDKRLREVVFRAKAGYLLYFRINVSFQATFPAPSRPGVVFTFPNIGWSPFNPFEDTMSSIDPDEDNGQSASIVNPVTGGMLTKYRWWKPKKHERADRVRPPVLEEGDWVIDAAGWAGVYNHLYNGQVADGIMPYEEALEQLRTSYGEYWNSLGGSPFRPELFGVTLAPHLELIGGRYYEVDTPGPPDPKFFQIANTNGWRYHQNPGKLGKPTYTSSSTAVVAINTAKIAKKLPEDNNKIYQFRIDLPGGSKRPVVGDIGVTVDALVDVDMYSTKKSTPPKDKERSDFPLKNDDQDQLNPMWPEWQYRQSGGGGVLKGGVGDSYCIVTIVFDGVPGVPPGVTIESFISSLAVG